MHIVYTRHAETRMQQRGIRDGDVALVLACGTQIDEEIWMLRNRDVKREIEYRKREIQALGRLLNKKVVMRGERVVTIYASGSPDQKRALRRGRRKGLVK